MTAYVLAHNNQVINGPRAWNYRSFESTLEEDLEIAFKLPMSKTDEDVIVIDENTKIYAAELVYQSYNSKIEYLHGPFWDFTSGKAIGTFQIVANEIEAIKNTLKDRVTANRWRKEVAGTTATIQSTVVTVDTARGNRDIFVQKYLLMGENDTVQWKFPEGWLTLSKSELGTAVSAGAIHVQSQFEWEAAKLSEIDACTTAQALNVIELGDISTVIPNIANFNQNI